MRGSHIIFALAGILLPGCKSGKSFSSSNQSTEGQLSFFTYNGFVEEFSQPSINIVDYEFMVDEVVAIREGKEVKGSIPPHANLEHRLKDHLDNKNIIEGIWFPKGDYDRLKVKFKKWPVAVLEDENGESIRILSRTLTQVIDANKFTSDGESFDIQLYTDQPTPLTTNNAKNVFAKVRKARSSKSPTSQPGSVAGCDYFAAIDNKGTFPSLDAAISQSVTRDIILLGSHANGMRLHISLASDVAISSNCNVTLDSIHVQKSKNVAFSNLSVTPTDPEVHAIMLQGSAFLNENIVISNVRISGEKGGIDGIHIGPHNRKVTVISSLVTSFAGNGIDVHQNNDGVEIYNNKISKNVGYGISIDKEVGSNINISNNRIERNGKTGLNLGEGLNIDVTLNKIIANGLSGGGYGVFVAGHKPEAVNPDNYTFVDNTIIGNNGTIDPGKSTANIGNYNLIVNANDKNNILESDNIPQTIDSGMLGPNEKYLYSDDNVTISIPMTAANSAIDISVRTLQHQELTGDDSDTLLPNMAYEFGPSGKTFETPIEVVFKYNEKILQTLGISDPSKIYLKSYDPESDSWRLTTTIHDDEAKVIIGYIFHFSRYAYGYSDPRWPALDPQNVPPRPLRFPGASARPPQLRDTHDSGDTIVMDYPWAQSPNGCSVISGVRKVFPEFVPVCNQHDKCYYEFRGSLDKWTLTRQAWSSCNQNFTADLAKTCNPFYIKEKRKIKTVKDLWGTLVDVFETVLVKTATSELCINSATTMASAVSSFAVLRDGVPPCANGGCYTQAQKKQLHYQEWLATVVREPHCTVTGTPDKLSLNIDSWDQPHGANEDPYFEIISGLNTPGVSLEKKAYNEWGGKIDRLGDFEFKVKNIFTNQESTCGVVISELPPELLPMGYVDVISVIDSCLAGYDRLPIDLNEGAGGEFIFFCGRVGKNIRMVTDVTIVGGPRGADCPDGYLKEHLDLNAGAGGWYIYLCKKVQSVVDGMTKPLTGLHVYSSYDQVNLCAPDFQWIDFDLNKGAEGRFVYLCKK